MSEKADLQRKTIEALQHYREALARAEELEQEEAAARREVFKRLKRFEISSAQDDASRVRPEIVEAGQASLSRLSEIRAALSEATATLDSAYRMLVALDEELGYIPGVGAAEPNARETGPGESTDVV
jgi:DNA repair ATPase RecN